MHLKPVGVHVVDEVIEEAVGRRHRPDPVLGRTAGPAGNAQLTAWTGLVLLALAVVELVTLIDVRGLSWHVAVGVLLAAVAVIGTTRGCAGGVRGSPCWWSRWSPGRWPLR